MMPLKIKEAAVLRQFRQNNAPSPCGEQQRGMAARTLLIPSVSCKPLSRLPFRTRELAGAAAGVARGIPAKLASTRVVMQTWASTGGPTVLRSRSCVYSGWVDQDFVRRASSGSASQFLSRRSTFIALAPLDGV